MKKRLLLFLCIFTLLLSTAAQAEDVTAADVPAPAPSAEKADTLSPFARTRSYDGRFTDVDASAWYHDAVAALYEYGLTEGVSSSAYAPEGSVTIAELVTFAARLHALERGAAIPTAAAGEAWYQPYVRYLKAEKCLGDELDGHYPEAATRAQMAGVLASALSAECYDERNAEAVTVGYASHRRITDVDDYTPYQSDILRLYKWGIVGGVNEDGSFHPNDTLKRSELAALVVRMVEPSARLTLSWQSLSYRSAAGTTWGDLIAAPAEVSNAPAADDANAIDALIRKMLHDGADSITLQYDRTLTNEEVAKLTRAFTVGVKRHCEQMYNSTSCRSYSSGKVLLTFSSTACDSAQLKKYREETLARAILVHDALWESGYLTGDMTQYELARAYYVWLCNNCIYDEGTVSSSSLSHLAYSALVDGVAVCDGYTGAYDLLLRLEGIECTALMNADHIWTVAELDGKTYHIDTTWGDQGTRVDMSFFGMTETQSRAKHAW